MRKLFMISLLVVSMTGCLGLSFGDKNYNCRCVEDESSCPIIQALDCNDKPKKRCCSKKPKATSRPARKVD